MELFFRASLGVRGGRDWTQDMVGTSGESECSWAEPTSASQSPVLLPSQRLHVLTPGLGKQAETSFSLTTCGCILVFSVWL